MPSHGAQHGSMSAGDSDGAGLGVQSVIKRCANGEDPAARAALCLEDHDGQAGLAKQIGGAQPGKAGAHDDRRIAVDRARARAERDGGERNGPRGLLEKAPPVHGVIMARLRRPSTASGRAANRCRLPELRSSVRDPSAAAAINGFVPSTSVQRDLLPGCPDFTDRLTVIAAMRTSARS